MTTPALTCLVADDHPAVLEAVCEFLAQHGIDVADRARDGHEAALKIETRQPALALLDVRMPGLSGVDVAKRIAQTSPGTAVVLYTGLADRALVVDALDAGIRGFVLKEAPLDDLVRALETVAAGGIYVDPVLGGVLTSAETTSQVPTLTRREREILRLLADGLTNEAIGRELFISSETVRTHIRKAMAKLDADTRTQAVATALRQSLIV